MTNTPYQDPLELGSQLLVEEDEDEKEEIIPEPKKEKTIRETLPQWATDPSVMKNEKNWFKKFGYSLIFGDYHPSHLTGLKVGDKPFLDHTKDELKDISGRDIVQMEADRLRDNIKGEIDHYQDAFENKQYGAIATRPIYNAARIALPNRDIANSLYLGLPTAVTGTARFLANTRNVDISGITQGINDAFYGGAGEFTTKLQGQMTVDERQNDALRTEIVGALASAPVWFKALGALRNIPVIGKVAGLVDPRTAKTPLGLVFKSLGFAGVEELTTAMTTDPRITGSIAGLFVGDERDPAMQDGLTMNQAYLEKIKFDVPLGMAIGALPEVMEALGSLKGSPALKDFKIDLGDLRNSVEWKNLQKLNLKNLTPSFRRAKRSKNYARKAENTRNFLEEQGVIEKNDVGKYDSPVVPKDANDAEAAFREKFIPVDQSVPEIDTTIQTADNLVDEDVSEVLARVQGGENHVDVIEEISQREEIAAAPDATFGLTTAPISSLSGTKYYEQLGSIDLPTLRTVANSDDQFGLEILNLTGKEANELDRSELIESFKLLEQKGKAVLPNRLTGQQYLSTDEIAVDVNRFQYKQNVDQSGVQKGGSLQGVEKWNLDLEGTVDVWRDPADGKTYIVNGHNRLQTAKQLQIPSLRVNYIVANTAQEAKISGALANIASGSGTTIDAAKFFKAGKLTDADQLAELGLPFSSGLATEGLAVSKLPENIFQDFIDGKITRVKAMALGGSGLDEASMQQAYKVLKTKDMSDATFSQVIEQAKLAPVVEGKQVDLFGNSETLNLMVEKARIAARIEADLLKDKNLFARVKANKKRLAEGGTKVGDKTGQIVSDASLAIDQFKAQKFTRTRLSQLLDQGAIDLSQGAKFNVVKSKIQDEFVASLNDAELQKFVEPPAPEPTPPPTKKEMLTEIATTALQKGEARVPSTEIPPIPKVDDVDLDKAFKNLEKEETNEEFAKLVKNESRLREEQARIDDSVEADRLAKERAQTKYYEKTYEQKKKEGALDALRRDIKPTQDSIDAERSARSMFGMDATTVADDEVKQITKMGEGRLNFEIGKYGKKTLTDRKIKNRVKKLKDFEAKQEKWFEINKDMDLQLKAGKDGNRALTEAETKALDKAASRGKKIMLERRIQKIDLAEQELYDHNYSQALLREKAKRDFINREIVSKRIFEGETGKAFNRLVKAMDSALGHKWKGGLDTVGDVANVLNVARRTTELSIYKALEDFENVTTSKSGRRLNADEQFPFIKPFLSKNPEYRARLKEERLARQNKKLQSSITGIDYTNGAYDEYYYRRYLQGLKDREAITAADSLAEYGRRISDDINGRIFQSKVLADEMLGAMKDALRVSGIPFNNLKVFDEINMLERFGKEEIARTVAEWDAGRASFISLNPDDPLAKTAAGTTGGLYVPIDYSEKVQQSIYLALYPALNQRLGGLLSSAPQGGRPFSWTAYHEAFHGVQDLLDRLGLTNYKSILNTDESIKEMVGIIKKYGGNFKSTMSNVEIQAEAFGIWATNRKIKLTKGGIVKTAFERLKKFIQSLRIKYDLIRKKDLDYADIFEIAAKGNFAKVAAIEGLSDQQLLFLTPKLNAWSHKHAPQLTMRIFNYLEAKKVDYDNMIFGTNSKFNKEGC